MDVQRRADAFERFDDATDLPMLVLALVFLPVLVIPAVIELSPEATVAFETAGWLIWALFAAELVVKTYLAPRRLHFLLTHWFDVLIVLLPLLRPLQIARTAKALRAITALRAMGLVVRVIASTREILQRHGLQWALLTGGVLFAGSALAVAHFESEGAGSIQDIGTALWWAAVTVTTVGYGDTFPVTPAGRGVGVFLMLVGIALFGLVTANIASFFIEAHYQTDTKSATIDDVMVQLRRLEEQLAELRAGREAPRAGDRQTDGAPMRD